MWVEKYRPSNFNDLCGQESIVERLEKFIENPKEIPHLLLAGPPGVGKTTAALIMCKKILGENWKDFTLELNASDERGINTVRDKIKTFARHIDFRNKIPFRIIILDEADEMTNDAQTALRRIMESSSKTTRFILICNYSSRIIEPIQSRCSVFRFNKLDNEKIEKHLKKICKSEKIKFSEEALEKITEAVNGDLRHSINLLQSSTDSGKLDSDTVEKIAGISGKDKVSDIISNALEGNFKEASQKLNILINVYGMNERDFLKFANSNISNMEIKEIERVIKILAKYDYRLIMGANPIIQLNALLSELALIKNS